MCSSFKEISFRSVSLPLFVCEEGVAFWGMERTWVHPSVMESPDWVRG